MTAFQPAGTSVTGAISLLQREPMKPEAWQRLADCLRAQSDSLSSDSLDVIVAGLWELKRISDSAVEKGEPPPALSSTATAQFQRLSSSYNDPRILKNIGEIYLNEWRLPGIARKHFERALFLGGSEKDLKPLLEASVMVAEPAMLRTKAADEAAGARAERTKDCLERARQALAGGELARAETLLREANQNPIRPDKLGYVWSELGFAYFRIEAYSQMEEAYRWALHYDKRELAYAFNLGLAQHSLGKFDAAEASYLMADRIRPGEAKVWCNLGSLYFENKRYPEAEAGLNKAIAAHPQYARAWDNLAAVLGAQNKLDEALAAVETALKIQPDFPEAHFKLGTILFRKNSLLESREAFRRSQCVPSLIEPAQAYLAMIESRLAS